MDADNGGKIWEKTYGGDKDDIGEGIIESENNTFVVVAGTFSYGKGGDVLLMKINSDGESGRTTMEETK